MGQDTDPFWDASEFWVVSNVNVGEGKYARVKVMCR